jgi:CCR4-NOT transcription complex subunit 7/8
MSITKNPRAIKSHRNSGDDKDFEYVPLLESQNKFFNVLRIDYQKYFNIFENDVKKLSQDGHYVLKKDCFIKEIENKKKFNDNVYLSHSNFHKVKNNNSNKNKNSLINNFRSVSSDHFSKDNFCASDGFIKNTLNFGNLQNNKNKIRNFKIIKKKITNNVKDNKDNNNKDHKDNNVKDHKDDNKKDHKERNLIKSSNPNSYYSDNQNNYFDKNSNDNNNSIKYDKISICKDQTNSSLKNCNFETYKKPRNSVYSTRTPELIKQFILEIGDKKVIRGRKLHQKIASIYNYQKRSNSLEEYKNYIKKESSLINSLNRSSTAKSVKSNKSLDNIIGKNLSKRDLEKCKLQRRLNKKDHLNLSQFIFENFDQKKYNNNDRSFKTIKLDKISNDSISVMNFSHLKILPKYPNNTKISIFENNKEKRIPFCPTNNVIIDKKNSSAVQEKSIEKGIKEEKVSYIKRFFSSDAYYLSPRNNDNFNSLNSKNNTINNNKESLENKSSIFFSSLNFLTEKLSF